MKKLNLIIACTGLVLASCANDELVNPVPSQETQNVPMDFAVTSANQSRDAVQLNTVVDNFGVWAIKANDGKYYEADITATTDNQLVMGNYYVKYDPSTPNGLTSPTDQYWVYEGKKTGQYLKYWDGSFEKTYFFAYSPWDTNQGFNDGFNNSGKAKLVFPSIAGIGKNTPMYMFSAGVETNADHISTSTAVPLTFQRLLSTIQIAFHEDVPGYKVELESVYYSGETVGEVSTNDRNGTAYAGHGVVAIPYNGTGTSKATYTQSGHPTVEFDQAAPNDLTKANVSWTNSGTSSENISFSPTLYNASCIPTIGTATAVTTIPDNTGAGTKTYAYSPDYLNVLPNSSNCGFQFLINFKLVAEDTKETIHVRGARVNVPSTCTAWTANTLYTYIFKISKSATGTTTPTQPSSDPEPSPTPALFPIIFDNIQVTDFAKNETHEYEVSGAELTTHP